MKDKLNKKFYKIGDVAEILNVPTSTLRFWEKEFTVIKPKRNAKNIRVYTVKDIETIKMIYYLVKEKGLKLDAAQAMIKRNRDGISKQWEVVDRLKQVREQLFKLDEALASLKGVEERQAERLTCQPEGTGQPASSPQHGLLKKQAAL